METLAKLLAAMLRPTAFEENIWQASSSVNTIVLLIVSPIDYLLENYDFNKGFFMSFSMSLWLSLCSREANAYCSMSSRAQDRLPVYARYLEVADLKVERRNVELQFDSTPTD